MSARTASAPAVDNAAIVALLLQVVTLLQPTEPAKPVKAPARKAAAKKAAPVESTFGADMRTKRLARRDSNPLGGLTSTERRLLAAANRPALKGLSGEAYATAWAAIVAAHKAA